MKRQRQLFPLSGLAIVLSGLITMSAIFTSEISAGPYACEEDIIEVKFARDAQVRLRADNLVDLSTANALMGVDQVLVRVSWAEWYRMCETPEELLDEFTAQAQANTDKRLTNPNNMYHLHIAPDVDVWEISRDLEALPGIQTARPVPKPMAPPVPDDYTPAQGYLRPASASPCGIDADWAWTQPGGDGTGAKVCDVEYSWNYLHADVTKALSSQIHMYCADPASDDNHGTAVAGVLSSDPNGWGTTGIAHGATLKTSCSYYGNPTPVWNVPGALIDAAASGHLNPGDIILVEHQWDLTGSGGYVPIEWWTDSGTTQTYNTVYSSIEWVLAYKFTPVIECAGNGGIDLDGLNWYGDSGGIIVGAGGAYTGGTYPEGDLQRLSFSCYGSRVDCHGWGEDVVTTGYGYLHSSEGVNYYYTDRFDGTSSAGAVVAGAATCCAGYWNANVSTRWPLDWSNLRHILRTTGTPQVFPPAGHIGPRPDLRQLFAKLDDWKDVTTAPLDYNGGFGNWGDYDADGAIDLYVGNWGGPSNKLYRNDGGGNFTDVTTTLLGDQAGYAAGAVWGDYDNDGDLDLYLANSTNAWNKLFRNDNGTFVDATSGPLGHHNIGDGPTWVDYDSDGDIDLYVDKYGGANKLLRNDGGGNFTDVTSGPIGDTNYATHTTWVDYDNDADLDVYILNHDGPNKLLRNDGGGTFTDVTSGPLDFNEGAMAAWGDYDNDGDPDLYIVIGIFGFSNKLLRNDGGGVFTDVTTSSVNETDHCFGASWGDVDNDGDLDLYLLKTQQYGNRLILNNGGGSFSDDTHGMLAWRGYDPNNCWGDYDNDGDLDSYFCVDFPANSNTLAQNKSTGSNHWLQVDLVGTASNRDGIGARVRIVTGRGVQVREISAGYAEQSLIASFGLGGTTTVDTLQVIWPGGTVQESLSVAVDQRVIITEDAPSSA
ncbi:MAG: FG-GAP-like repeat-containing protein, partial [Planctomycetota bacterium]